ncbi:hypothetical protein CTRI78_v012189 [Colletotrichum trifolii]|uniref:Uncharacterized protein n=1 Tax=Colletotrichum trifolii TaxID=5466 RepID=A0A4R8PQQ2_COLTR|nr:hypothetical protein CTRI78_v012189 [Colletotrichum trifolii]
MLAHPSTKCVLSEAVSLRSVKRQVCGSLETTSQVDEAGAARSQRSKRDQNTAPSAAIVQASQSQAPCLPSHRKRTLARPGKLAL